MDKLLLFSYLHYKHLHSPITKSVILRMYETLYYLKVPPINTWGTHFAVVPLATRKGMTLLKVGSIFQNL